MTVYISIYAIAVFLFLYEFKDSDKYLRFLSHIAFIAFLFLIYVLRFEVGTDYNNYKEIFSLAKFQQSILENLLNEPLFLGMNILCKKVNNNYQFFIFVVTLVTFIFTFSTFKTNRYEKTLFYLIFCLLPSFCVIRQFISIAFSLASLECIKKKKYFYAFTFIFIGFLFHKSTLFFLIFLILRNFLKLNYKMTVVISILLFFSIFFTNFFQNLLLKLISFTPYKNYLEFLDQILESKGSGLGVIIQFIAFQFLLFAYNKFPIDSQFVEKDNFIFTVCMFFLLIGVKMQILSRIAMTFYPFFFAFIGNVQIKKTRELLFAFFFLLAITLTNQLRVGMWGVIPYKTIYGTVFL